MRPAPHLLALVVFIGVAPSLLAAQQASHDAREWVERMTRAAYSQDYAGTFIYIHGDKLESMRIVHRADDGGGSERLLSLNGVPREIIRNAARVTCILPEHDASGGIPRRLVINPISNLVPGDLEGIEAAYSLELAGRGRVAGRETQQVRIRPLDRFRYGYELWIDVKTGLPLRLALIGERSRPVKQVMFVDLELPERIPAARLEPTLAGEGFTWSRDHPEVKVAKPGPSPWRVTDLPPGFRLTLYERRRMPGSDRLVEHRLYSDGLASVSVYVEREDDGASVVSFTGGSSRGAVSAYGRMVSGYQTVVVGEVPLATVRRIGRSIERDTETGR